ncbi:MAG: anthranilate phosphoribosyltransferase [Lentisphaeria bacterium]|nr:anthranilate phosphoribosyltransferase [Lentisphaeria bacterium]
MLNEALKKVIAGGVLTESESAAMVEAIADGENMCAAGLLAALAMRGESVSEMTGAAGFLRDRMTAVDAGDCADIVGTGGDGGRSFNISTAASFVAAGAGVRMAKHGNRAVSGKCGAADVLEELGVPLNGEPEKLADSIRGNGIAFLFARNLHPVMAKVAPLRRDLGIRTIFNLVGPLANPARAVYMVVGVYHERLVMPFAEVLRNLGVRSGFVCTARTASTRSPASPSRTPPRFRRTASASSSSTRRNCWTTRHCAKARSRAATRRKTAASCSTFSPDATAQPNAEPCS